MSLDRICALAAIYPAVWGAGQLATGALSDRLGRKWLIAVGLWVQAAGIAVIVLSSQFAGFAEGAVLLGTGTAKGGDGGLEEAVSVCGAALRVAVARSSSARR